jgi:hypothetical protein
MIIVENITDSKLEHAYKIACEAARDIYGILVIEDTLEAPKTGEFNGENIFLESSMNIKEKMFLLVHLFGHNVQWLTSEKYRNIGLSQPEFADFESTRKDFISKLDMIHDYETVACSYGLQLLHDAGVYSLDEWVSNIAWADWLFLKESYVDGFKQENRDNFWVKYLNNDYPMLKPLKLPKFTTKLYESRYAF